MLGFILLPFMWIFSIPYHLGFDAVSAALLDGVMGAVIALVRFFIWGF